MIKIIIIAVFLVILFSLGSALFHLVKHKGDKGPSPEVVKALTVRIALSLLLFVIVFILVATGVFRPQGIGSKLHAQINSTQSNKSLPTE
ncbi:MAG: twin transmembrane helix small protein [Methylococcaceae bacterium]|nr:twin transmembrane helix small protein [Methylococcaceae bacterium]